MLQLSLTSPMTRPFLTLLTLTLALLSPVQVLGDELPSDVILVIVHKDTSVDSLARDELRPIFQTKKSEWQDGSTIRALNLPPSDSVRRGFDSAVLGLDPERVARYWVDRKIRGGNRAPMEMTSSQRVLATVSRIKGAIGYVAGSENTDNVKVVAKIYHGDVHSP